MLIRKCCTLMNYWDGSMWIANRTDHFSTARLIILHVLQQGAVWTSGASLRVHILHLNAATWKIQSRREGSLDGASWIQLPLQTCMHANMLRYNEDAAKLWVFWSFLSCSCVSWFGQGEVDGSLVAAHICLSVDYNQTLWLYLLKCWWTIWKSLWRSRWNIREPAVLLLSGANESRVAVSVGRKNKMWLSCHLVHFALLPVHQFH